MTWKSIVAPPDSLTVAFAGLDARPVIRQSSSMIVPVPDAVPTATESVVSVANVPPVRVTVIVRLSAGVVSPLIGTGMLSVVPEAVLAGIENAGVEPSELVYETLIASGVADGPVTVTGNVIEFAPCESPSGDVDGDALPIEIVHACGSALTVPVAAKSSVPASRAARTRRPPIPNFPPIRPSNPLCGSRRNHVLRRSLAPYCTLFDSTAG